ncbi:MAG: 4-hydroxy-tetrahydrodipicolinate synthase [Thiohalomonadales bacterium]
MFQGSMVALVTPMALDGTVDYKKLSDLVEFHISNNTDAIVTVGTTGESATLDAVEHCDVIRQVVMYASGRIPIIAGTGSNSTREAIELTSCAKEAGADACLLVTPYYNKPTQVGLYEHYKKIAESVAIPQILYNVPGRTVCDMLPQTVARLAKISNIIGIKEATGDIDRTRQILDLCNNQVEDNHVTGDANTSNNSHQEFEVYSGDDGTAVELILNGAVGDISVTANVAPSAMHDMCMAALKGDRETAESINKQLMPLHENLFLEANPIPVKWALYKMGLIAEGIRLPLTPLSEDYREELKQAMLSANVI